MLTDVETVSFEDEFPQKLAPREQFNLRCPDCGDFLRLTASREAGNFFYGCRQWSTTGCKGNHAANKDGSPRGVPANAETRRWRKLAHEFFDRLWSGPTPRMTKNDAYFWMALRLNLSLNQRDRGIGCLDRQQCEWLIEVIKKEFPEYRTAWDMLGESF